MAKSEKKWNIGIDFGTSFNYVFGWKIKGKFKDFLKDKNGIRIDIVDPRKDGENGIPSKIDNDKNIGNKAQNDESVAGNNDVKTLIRCNLRNQNDEDKVLGFFNSLFKELRKNGFPDIKDIDNIVVGGPCVTSEELIRNQKSKERQKTNNEYKSILTDIIAESLCSLASLNTLGINKADFSKKIKCIEEPILAGYAYFAATSQIEEQQILVIDGGGGTLDFAHIVKKPDRLYYYKLCGGLGPAGQAVSESLKAFLESIYIDDKLIELSDYDIEEYKAKLFSSTDFLKIDIPGRIPRDSKAKRHNLLILERNKSDDLQNKVKMQIKSDGEAISKAFYLATNRKDDEPFDISDIISAPVDDAKGIINTMYSETMSKDEKQNHRPDKVLFTGGMSHIADFRDRVIKYLKENGILDDEDNKNSDLVIFPKEDSNGEHIKGTHTIGGITLTSSNIVALGACIAASNKYFAIESENDIYVGTYDVDEENYNVHMLGDVYIRFEKGEQKVEFPLFDSDKTPTDRETAVFIQNIAKYKTDGRSKYVIWEKIGTQKILKFKIIVKSKNGADGTSKELCSFPVDKGMLVVSNGKKDDISIDSDGKTHNEKYFMVKLNKDDDCSLLISLNNFIVNIYALPVEDIMAFSSEKSKDTEKLSNASCCII